MVLKKFFHAQPILDPPAPGIYHFREKSSQGESRMHLRIDSDGSGILMVNASRVYHFNPTAAFMTYLLVQKVPEKQAIRSITHAYQVKADRASADYFMLAPQIRLVTTPGYDQIAALIQDFTSLTEDEILALMQAGQTLQDTEFSQIVLFLQPEDDEDCLALIPAIASLDSRRQEILQDHLRASGLGRLHTLIHSITQLEPAVLEKIIAVEQDCPGSDLVEPVFDTILPFSVTDLSAPYRMDLALTYQCNNRCHHCYNPAQRHRQELDTQTWKQIIDELWKIGIPHIIFTGGEPTLRSDLPDLIAHAEANGQITGINTNGRRLKDPQFVAELTQAGLDHVQITIESHDAGIHDEMVAYPGAWQETVSGIRNIVQSRLYFMTNTTLLNNNYLGLRETLQFLADLGVKRLGLNALIYAGQGAAVGSGLSESILPELLLTAKEMTEKNNQKLTWYTPTQYCHFDPVLFDFQTLGVKGCTAALYNMCIEPDGKVLPCQSYYQPVGNILQDPWDKIWGSDLAVSLRNRRHVAEECKGCSLLSVCGGGCPLAFQAGKVDPPRTIHFIDA